MSGVRVVAGAVRRVAVVGAGMAAARFAEQMAGRAPEVEVTLYGAEAHVPYNRALLAEVLTGRLRPEDVALPAGNGTRVRTGTRVVGVDVAARAVRLADGSGAGYDHLVLAVGAEPVLPRLPGLRTVGGPAEGVHVLRTLDDCGRLAGAAASAGRAVVVGGGVLGVSAARALTALGVTTELVHEASHLIGRHLDAGASGTLVRGLTALGIGVHLGARPHALRGTGRVTGVELADGRVLDADLLVLACGVRPRTGLARRAGLRTAYGVVVDDHLATSAPHISAIGDCAEHRGVAHGLAGPAWDQADVLAARLSGAGPEAAYPGSPRLFRLTAGPLEYAAFGETGDVPGADVVRLADATRGSYRKLVLRGDRLVGGILLGDLTAVGDLTRAFLDGAHALPGDPTHLLTTEGAA
ncbi:NAD(P)/FAD-dependent oxidoreductase [Streptantibioticus cattleyicolor]|uniref:FAD-dependent pyridine nucleotide-disulfide oxidoreductase n=1 Tax=Streptantibioticus cattleyicolor (strain ATCC 35852 / DSM 46488 / JCM 4925 / NBRC 14057 / NRRL 8057) TaxID=1003195 RepID=F8JNG5_STREN|nr:FAD-dependent oxidoreductase [Streptantibioticus cattleyicolor]AEW99068.1 FAD-dependent pyridine nucleotide-disulfide oxidoreductase [Streptantibioticus cattleyicolor NRRL 8057 = DSM 46488]CCB71885.1 Nitrite reductase large subunit [Streptantibioticus cattleyicolor NRRL 8057 = DSM 46488]